MVKTLIRTKNLLFVPLLLGIILMICAWFFSYPLTIDSPSDYVFNHVSILYWISLPLIMASMYLIGIYSKKPILKWIMVVGIIAAMFSVSYYYYLLPGSDMQTFRGLTEYYTQTNSLAPIDSAHQYYSWPFFFIIENAATSISGLTIAQFEFILYAVIGILLVTTLFKYSSDETKQGSFVSVIGFFLAVFYFLNYQSVPFSLSLALLFLLLMIEKTICSGVAKKSWIYFNYPYSFY